MSKQKPPCKYVAGVTLRPSKDATLKFDPFVATYVWLEDEDEFGGPTQASTLEVLNDAYQQTDFEVVSVSPIVKV